MIGWYNLPVDGVGEATQDALSHSDSPLFASVCVGELTIALAAATQLTGTIFFFHTQNNQFNEVKGNELLAVTSYRYTIGLTRELITNV